VELQLGPDAPGRAAAAARGERAHAVARDADGWYGKRWDEPPRPGAAVELLDQASAARAWWELAGDKRSGRP